MNSIINISILFIFATSTFIGCSSKTLLKNQLKSQDLIGKFIKLDLEKDPADPSRLLIKKSHLLSSIFQTSLNQSKKADSESNLNLVIKNAEDKELFLTSFKFNTAHYCEPPLTKQDVGISHDHQLDNASVTIPYIKEMAKIEIKDAQGNMFSVFDFESDIQFEQVVPGESQPSFSLDVGEEYPSKKINIVLYSAEYTPSQESAFQSTSDKIINHFRSIEPYKSMDNDINYVKIFTQEDLGCTEFFAGLYRIMLCDQAAADSLAIQQGIEPDVNLILWKGMEIGGMANGGRNAVAAADSAVTVNIATHEVGHVFGLRDEYKRAETAPLHGYPIANCFSGTPPVGIWDGLVDKYVKGCEHGNQYRSSQDSVMLGYNAKDHNRVSQEIIRGNILQRLGKSTPPIFKSVKSVPGEPFTLSNIVVDIERNFTLNSWVPEVRKIGDAEWGYANLVSGQYTDGTASTSLQIRSLEYGTTYEVRIKGLMRDRMYNRGRYLYSEKILTITTEYGPPRLPELKVAAKTAHSITLEWEKSPVATGYVIYREIGDGYKSSINTPIATLPADVTTFTDEGLLESTYYYYRASSFNATYDSNISAGATKKENSVIYVKTAHQPFTSLVTVTPARDCQVAFHFDRDSEEAYRLYDDSDNYIDSTAVRDGIKNVVTTKGLACSSSYETIFYYQAAGYQVKAVKIGDYSITTGEKFLQAPVVSDVKYLREKGTALVSWGGIKDAIEYSITVQSSGVETFIKEVAEIEVPLVSGIVQYISIHAISQFGEKTIESSPLRLLYASNPPAKQDFDAPPVFSEQDGTIRMAADYVTYNSLHFEYQKKPSADWIPMAWSGSSSITFVVPNLGFEYRFRVRSENSAGLGDYSDPSDWVSTGPKPKLGTVVVTIEPPVKGQPLSISWKKIANADSYIVQVKQADGTWKEIKKLDGTITKYTFEEESSSSINIRVVASSNNGAYVESTSIVTNYIPDLPDTTVTLAKPTHDTVLVEWEALYEADLFELSLTDKDSFSKTITIDGGSRSSSIGGLPSDTRFEVTILGKKGVQKSISAAYVFSTKKMPISRLIRQSKIEPENISIAVSGENQIMTFSETTKEGTLVYYAIKKDSQWSDVASVRGLTGSGFLQFGVPGYSMNGSPFVFLTSNTKGGCETFLLIPGKTLSETRVSKELVHGGFCMQPKVTSSLYRRQISYSVESATTNELIYSDVPNDVKLNFSKTAIGLGNVLLEIQAGASDDLILFVNSSESDPSKTGLKVSNLSFENSEMFSSIETTELIGSTTYNASSSGDVLFFSTKIDGKYQLRIVKDIANQWQALPNSFVSVEPIEVLEDSPGSEKFVVKTIGINPAESHIYRLWIDAENKIQTTEIFVGESAIPVLSNILNTLMIPENYLVLKSGAYWVNQKISLTKSKLVFPDFVKKGEYDLIARILIGVDANYLIGVEKKTVDNSFRIMEFETVLE